MTLKTIFKIFKSSRFLISLVVVVVILAPLCFYDNIDRTPWEEPYDNGLRIRVNSKRTLTQEELIQQHDMLETSSIQDTLTQTKNICIAGQDPTTLTIEEHVEAFNAGPCNPVVLIPGLAGTSLQIQIDCDKLAAGRPDIFKGCGWSTCSRYVYWNRRPDSEYRLWISSVTSPVGIIMASKKTSCFGDVIQLLYDHTQPEIKKRYSDIPGVEITYYGNTPRTAQFNECGLGAIGELTDDQFIKLTGCEHRGFSNLKLLYLNMGYLSGIMMQAIPYDYRKSIVSSNIPDIIVQTIENLHQITGKKVVILTHSLGSLYGLHTLSTKSQEWKDEHVQTLMTAGGPYLGSTKAVRSTLGGDPAYMDKWLGHNVGINYYCQNKAINSGSSTMDLYPRDTFFKFQNEPWMKELQHRIKYEQDYANNITNSTTIPMDWFPSPKNNCASGKTTRSQNCQTFLSDYTRPFLQIGNQSFTSKREDILEMLLKYSVNSTQLAQVLQEAELTSLSNLEHPGVPTIIVYGAFIKVEESFQYDLNPRSQIELNNDFYFPNVTTSAYGDGTVLASSAITPAIKWIYEHKNKKIKKPTKLVEFCSSYNQGNIDAIFDKDGEGTNTFGQSGYVGMSCECQTKKDYSSCKHSCMINDKYYVDLAAKVVQTGQRSLYQDYKSPLNYQQLNDFKSQCKNLAQEGL